MIRSGHILKMHLDSRPQAILTSIFAQLNGDVFGQFPSDLQQEYCVILIESASTTNVRSRS